MSARDFLLLSLRALAANRLRSFLTLLGIAVGIAAVILLTSIGEGLHQFVLREFTQFGTNLIEVTPGKRGTRGGPPGLPSTARALTLDDATALAHLPEIKAVTPVVFGNAEVDAGGRLRRTMVYGVGADMLQVFTMQLAAGRFLPADDSTNPRAFVVLGAKLKQELFGAANPLGERLRIGGERYRVIGVMAPKGQFLGTDLDDVAYIPAGRALSLFNRDGLVSINLAYQEGASVEEVAERVRQTLENRHGRVDFTLTTQADMLATLSNILGVLTAAVGALGGISLLVGGVGIVTIMTIAVAERTSEIGLLIALGARRRTVLGLFLGEAVMLSAAGGLCGLALGAGFAQLIGLALPALPVHTPLRFVVLAELLAVLIGLLAGVLPARRAARLDPVEALHAD